ncbi:acyl-CoA synthetase (AMP-forming)/AMP-acid ligase II [Bradyrhizobium sp. S3.12.5]|uniref:class I adenylate-forming enzyme family protein n=1 Tax=Bradyrhizobium sp. S3.12.5 TaxID=3156386 RepID=UPI0033960BE5
MTVTTKPAEIELQQQAANALRKLEVLEAVYETITVRQLVALRARTHGSAVAIDVFERGERATYSEVDRRSNEYAHALRAFGVRKGDRIGVMLPNRIEYPILWFAFAKLGAILVPINTRYTPREIEYVLGDTQARFAIVDEMAWSVFSKMDPWPQTLPKAQVIVVGRPSEGVTNLDELLKPADDGPVEEDVGPDDLLNIQYTSGTTGFPKGCMLTHDYWGVGSYALACIDTQPYTRYLAWSAFYYVDTLLALLRSYRQGGTLYLAERMSSSGFIGWLKKYRIEWCAFPEFVMREPEATDDTMTSLKQVHHFGGWSAESIRQFRTRFGVRGQNNYGMTEVAMATLMPNDIDHEGAPFGMRAPFRRLSLVDEDGSPTPVGEVGELWVSGRGIFKGYWRRPDANAQSFEGEWFKTGDLMRRDESGFYWLVGRTKDMIRRSGENIAAREIEAVIREIPEVADVAAVPVRDAKRGEEVKVFLELKDGVKVDDVSVERILQHARARLAAFKVPRYLAFTSALPRTVASNKVLKRELINIGDPLSGTYDADEKRWR